MPLAGDPGLVGGAALSPLHWTSMNLLSGSGSGESGPWRTSGWGLAGDFLFMGRIVIGSGPSLVDGSSKLGDTPM